jgi:hypothetical protein
VQTLNTVITDNSASEEMIAALRDAGVNVMLV